MKHEESIYITDYVPKSELVTEEHLIPVAKFPVIDIHSHFGSLVMGSNYADMYNTGEAVSRLKQYGFRKTVNLDGFFGAELDNMLRKIHPYEDFILTFGAVDVTRFDETGFEAYVYKTLQESKQKGIKGLKFWKNISLVLKDKAGKYIRIDDKRLKVIWDTAAELQLPVLIHIADPIAFFKPIDRFNERYEELLEHPDWSFCSPDIYSFEHLMEMQENLLKPVLPEELIEIVQKLIFEMEEDRRIRLRLDSLEEELKSRLIPADSELIKSTDEKSDEKLEITGENREHVKSVIKKAQDYILNNFAKLDISLILIAEYVYLNPAYFSKLYKKATGESYVDYITRLRIKEAKRLLKESNIKIGDIGTRVGYPNTQYFCTLFKRIVGLSPVEYRET